MPLIMASDISHIFASLLINCLKKQLYNSHSGADDCPIFPIISENVRSSILNDLICAVVSAKFVLIPIKKIGSDIIIIIANHVILLSYFVFIFPLTIISRLIVPVINTYKNINICIGTYPHPFYFLY